MTTIIKAVGTNSEATVYAAGAARTNALEITRPSNLRFEVQSTPVAVDPYLVVDGRPITDSGWGVASTSSVYIDSGALTSSQGYPSPAAARTGADYRFLVSSSYVDTDGSGNRRWFAVSNPNGNTFPRIVPRQQGATVDPSIDSGYVYESRHKKVPRPAWIQNRQGYFELQANAGTATYTKATLMMVFVPHAGPGVMYPLYDSGRVSSVANRLAVRYYKGQLRIYSSYARLLTYNIVLDHSEPMLLALSLDTDTNIGRCMVVDRRRWSRSFNIKTFAGLDLNGLIGAQYLNNNTTTADYANIGDLDLLDVELWLGRALTFGEMEPVVSVLSSVFNVGPA
jgi:hypothetical protein